MRCEEALDRITVHVVDRLTGRPGASGELPPRVLEHVATCASCMGELRALGGVLTGEASEALRAFAEEGACGLVGDLMPAWAERELAGGAPGREHAGAWGHLERCAACRRRYRELCEILREEDLVPPRAREEAVAGAWEEIGPGVKRWTSELEVLVGREGARVIPRGLAHARSGRASLPGGGAPAGRVNVLDEEAGLDLGLNVVPGSRGGIDLEVQVRRLRDLVGPPGLTFSLLSSGARAGRSVSDSPDGRARFRDVTPEDAVLRIQGRQRAWEFSLTFRRASAGEAGGAGTMGGEPGEGGPA